MKIFSSLFGKKANSLNPVTETSDTGNKVNTLNVATIPPAELFVDNQPPQVEQPSSEQVTNRINLFLQRDYLSMGFNDGYEYHSNETLESGKKKIKAEFLLIIDKSIEEKQLERLKIKNLLVDVSKVSEDASMKLENTIDELNISLNTLQKQKVLSVDNEGWVMSVIHAYHLGFKRGTDDFIAGEELLNSIKNI